jgi:hypothetical protein
VRRVFRLECIKRCLKAWAVCVQAGCGAEGTALEIPLLPLWNRRGKCHRIIDCLFHEELLTLQYKKTYIKVHGTTALNIQ